MSIRTPNDNAAEQYGEERVRYAAGTTYDLAEINPTLPADTYFATIDWDDDMGVGAVYMKVVDGQVVAAIAAADSDKVTGLLGPNEGKQLNMEGYGLCLNENVPAAIAFMEGR